MLRLRPQHMILLQQDQQRQTSRRIAADLRVQYAPIFQFYSAAQMEVWVSRQIDYLAEYKITEKHTCLAFIKLFALFGERFERCADPTWARVILQKTTENEQIRLLKISRLAEVQLHKLVE